MAALIIVGAGGHGRDVADIARACGWEPYFLDDRDLPDVIGRPHEIPAGANPIVAVNDPHTRQRLTPTWRTGPFPTLIHPTAVVSSSATLGEGVVVGAGTQIGPDTHVYDHTHIGPGCTLTRSHVGPFATIAPGVDIAGDCIIGELSLIGVGARVANLIKIGERVTVGAGSVVVEDVPNGATVKGVPAR